jgi:uncharacterized iron-regulated membrane protein
MVVIWHRWVGLLIAGFLVVSGLTGAVISWDHELDEWLNDHLIEAPGKGKPLPVLNIVKQIEAYYPTMQVLYTPLVTEPGHSLALYLEPRVNPETSFLYPQTFNQVFVDPVTGQELGKRHWGGAWPINSENFVSFLYILHYSLHIPAFWGIERWGVWLMGIIGLLWTLDCFGALYLTLPRSKKRRNNKKGIPNSQSWWQRWKPAWKIRWQRGSYKLNFDLHRAFSLWTWVLLLTVAFTGFSLNLYDEVFYPVMSQVSDVTPTAYDERKPTENNKPIKPTLDYAEAMRYATKTAARLGWNEPIGSIFYGRHYGVYSVDFYYSEDEHGSGGVGPRSLIIDAHDGRTLTVKEPWQGSAADIFVQAQFPLHSGRILGLPGRILISVMGLVVAMLSITGVIIWWRKLSARQRVEQTL